MTNLNQHTAETRFAQRLTARLDAQTSALPHDISERLRVARLQAVAQHRQNLLKSLAPAIANQHDGVLALGSDPERPGLWNLIASALPLIALIVGLVAIHVVQNDLRADEVAEVDAAILTDELPTAAYTDPGFAQFLKTEGMVQH